MAFIEEAAAILEVLEVDSAAFQRMAEAVETDSLSPAGVLPNF